MDWVKPKSKRQGSKPKTEFRELATNGTKKIAPPGKATSAATAWLESLCDENIAFLQQSLPLSRRRGGRRRPLSSGVEMAGAMRWGIGTLEGEIDEGLDVLQRLLQIYSKPLLLPGRTAENGDESSAAASQLQVKTCENVAKWINRSLPVYGTDPFVAVSCLAWVHGLSEVGREIDPGAWMEVLQNVLTQVDRAWSDSKPESLFPWLLWSCEAPIALAVQLTAFQSNHRMVGDAMSRLSRLLVEAGDNVSPWLTQGTRNLRALIASVVRTRWAADSLKEKAWGKLERNGLRVLVETALALSAPDGSSLLNEQDSETDEAEFWDAAIKLAGSPKSLKSMRELAVDEHPLKKRRRADQKLDAKHFGAKADPKHRRRTVFKEPGRYFEKAEIASMRRSWEHAGGRLTVDFSRDPIWLDCLGAGGRKLISGDWDLAIHRDGQPLTTDVAWSEVCWFSDDDVDYLELEAAVENQCRVQRQMILIRQEGWIILSDTLLGEQPANWSLESSWELTPEVRVASATKTHEAELMLREDAEKREALLLPLMLPEWRRVAAQGKLYGEAGKLKLKQEVHGTRIYSPLVLIPDYADRKRPFTWRHLTVAEDLTIQRPEVAQGYRVQVGDSQLVLYRSLAHPVRRSVLGLHLNSEFYCGRFDADEGTYEPIVEISSDE